MELKNNNFLYKILILVALIFFFVYITNYWHRKPGTTEIQVAGSTIYAQIAATENQKSLGLSYTKQIDDNAGMLFIFSDSDVRNFWMRDMYFDLDIIWLDENKDVVGFFERVPSTTTVATEVLSGPDAIEPSPPPHGACYA